MRHKPLPSQALLRELFDYDPESGELRWRKPPATCPYLLSSVAGAQKKWGYVEIKITGQLYKAHRLVWMWVHGEDPGQLEIDHRDRNRQNNRITNLRLAVDEQQNSNHGCRRDNRSGHKGVSWRSDVQRWRAEIQTGKSRISLGHFDTVEEAGKAYREAAARLHGEFQPDEFEGAGDLEERHVVPLEQRVRSTNTSGFHGVRWHRKSQKWCSQIRVNGKQKHLGCFDTPEAAAEAYRKAKEDQQCA